MRRETLKEMRDYLTTRKGEEVRVILDPEFLLDSEGEEKALALLRERLKAQERTLRNMILIDKTHHKVDRIVAVMFRLSMAIKTLEDQRKEVRTGDGTEHRTAAGGGVSPWDRGSDRRSRKRKDTDHDGADRDTGEGLRRSA